MKTEIDEIINQEIRKIWMDVKSDKQVNVNGLTDDVLFDIFKQAYFAGMKHSEYRQWRDIRNETPQEGEKILYINRYKSKKTGEIYDEYQVEDHYSQMFEFVYEEMVAWMPIPEFKQ